MHEFQLLFRLKSVYRVNSFLYYMKHFPLIHHFIPENMEANHAVKLAVMILTVMYELFTLCFWKICYLFMVFMLPMMMEITNAGQISLHLFFFLTLIGGILNTSLLDPTKDKYYAICLMRMDAKKVALSEFFYFQLKNIVGMSIAVLFVRQFVFIDGMICISIPIFVTAIKFMIGALLLKKSEQQVYNENNINIRKLVACLFFLMAAFGLPFIQILLPVKLYGIIVACVSLLGGGACFYLLSYSGYSALYKKLLLPENILFDSTQVQKKANQSYVEKIDYELIVTSKTGYAYFNDLFVARHKRILTQTANRIAYGCGIVILLLLLLLMVEPIKVTVHENLMSMLPYFLFIMYMINRGESITKALFINCDQAMLHYRFYKQPKAILELFKYRLIRLVQINLRPALVLAIGLVLLLYMSGGSDNVWDFVLLPTTILCLSVFFSVHYLVLYYVLQPYNSEVEMKNPLYRVISALTYFICYAFMQRIDSHYFGVWVIVLTLIYIVVSLLLAYKLAPKKFKLK